MITELIISYYKVRNDATFVLSSALNIQDKSQNISKGIAKQIIVIIFIFYFLVLFNWFISLPHHPSSRVRPAAAHMRLIDHMLQKIMKCDAACRYETVTSEEFLHNNMTSFNTVATSYNFDSFNECNCGVSPWPDLLHRTAFRFLATFPNGHLANLKI